MLKPYRAIGIFDSGFGGLDILKYIERELPAYDYIYLGDNARAPYGNRSHDVVYEFVKEGVEYLFQNGAELIILACNTGSSEALRRIQQEYLPKQYPTRRVLGVIIPTVEYVAGDLHAKRIGVIGTEGTIASMAFVRELHKLNPWVKVFQKACPLLAPIVEVGEERSSATTLILENYLKPLLRHNPEVIILACTHYGVLEKQISHIVGSKIKVIGEGKIVAKKLRTYLEKHSEIEKRIRKTGRRFFYTTDSTDRFKRVGSRLFGKKIKPIKVHIGK